MPASCARHACSFMPEPHELAVARYRTWYARLLRLYPKQHRERFGEGMQQAFHDLCRERIETGRGLFGLALAMFIEASASIARENLMAAQNKRLVIILLAITCILLLPLLAMRFTDEVRWTLFDFLVAGALLLGAGLAYEFFARKGGTLAYRVIVGMAIAAVLLVVWLELAVGIFGTPWAGS